MYFWKPHNTENLLQIKVARLLAELIDDISSYNQICGVPYIGLILGSIIGIEGGLPMVVRRLEEPTYGMRRKVEGMYEKGLKILMINDIVTSGTTVIETARDLAKEGLRVNTVLVVVDREQGAHRSLEKRGIQLKSLFVMSELLRYLNEEGRLSDDTMRTVVAYVARAPADVRNYLTRKYIYRIIYLRNRRFLFYIITIFRS